MRLLSVNKYRTSIQQRIWQTVIFNYWHRVFILVDSCLHSNINQSRQSEHLICISVAENKFLFEDRKQFMLMERAYTVFIASQKSKLSQIDIHSNANICGKSLFRIFLRQPKIPLQNVRKIIKVLVFV